MDSCTLRRAEPPYSSQAGSLPPFEFSYYIQLNLILYNKLKPGAMGAILSIHAFINAMGEKGGYNELLTSPKHITCFISLPKKDVWPCINSKGCEVQS